MVLAGRRGNPGLRFLAGAGLIVLCIYAFYLARARQVTPELFLVPQPVRVQESPCKVVKTAGLLACIPTGMQANPQPDGLHFSSLPDRVAGLIQIQAHLPQESQWRATLAKPLTKVFLGETGRLDTFHLMLTILEKRYNPTLMGAKARLLPPWMRGHPEACILVAEGMPALCFYTARQSLGIRFFKDRVVILTTTGPLDKTLALGILGAVTLP